MNKKKIFAAVVMSLVLSLLFSFGVSAETAQWIPNADGTWSYMESDGELVKDEVGYYIDGEYYGFDANGIMYTGWVQPYKNEITSGKEYRNTWFFFEPNGHAPGYGYNAETGYLFYSDGEVMADYYYSAGDQLFVSDKTGRATELVGLEWQFVNDRWYYVADDGYGKYLYREGLYTIGEATYYFGWEGYMGTNTFGYDYEYGEFYVDAEGKPIYDGWIAHDGYWYYLQDGETLGYGIHTIGDNRYYFDWDGRLVENQRFNNMYAGEGGALYYNNWRLTESGEWEYYDSYGYRVEGQMYTIGENKYYFDYDGKMVTDTVREFYDYDSGEYKYYSIASNGVLTVVSDGWVLDGSDWMYFEDGEPYSNRIANISGVDYAFAGNRLFNIDTWDHLYSEDNGWNYYSINANGTVNKTQGWDLAGDSWVFIQSDGTLKQGWLNDGSGWYYLSPSMYKNTTADIGGRTYYFNSSGKSEDVYANEFYKSSAEGTYFYEYGSRIDGWRQIDGNWYYFGYDLYTDGSYNIGDSRYYFDQNGVMLTGWIKSSGGYWYYADESGKLVTGAKTIGDTTYIFDEYGQLVTNRRYYLGGVNYLINADGVVIAKNTDPTGWIENNGNWYYLNNGYFCCGDDHYEIDGKYYAFDDYGVMKADEIYYSTYYQADGSAFVDGWLQINGKYLYANEYGHLYNDGLYSIDGDLYCFNGYEMVVGTYIYDTDIVVTDASGRISTVQPFTEGWNLVSEFGVGTYYYVQNGELYTGWVGNYYVDSYYGMYCGGINEVDGKDYYFYDNGLCAINTWIQDEDGDWLYAKENGELCQNEWLLQGSTYYYFSGYWMVEDVVYYIDGKEHQFADGGAWLGEVSGSAYNDGWHYIDGKWQYCQYGEFVIDGIRKIDGVWYGFDYEGMVTNGFNDYGYYMNASGVMVPYTGWQLIDGKWNYFTVENRSAQGWFTVDGVEYYNVYDGIATGYTSVYVNGEYVLYNFSASGACLGEVTEDGWYSNGSNWYYVRNGEMVRDDIVYIGGVRYAFGWNGIMLVYDYSYDEISGAYYLFGASGAQITTEGWYLIDGEWLYVDAQGYLCTGTHVIGGTTYYFDIAYYYYW